MAKKRGDIARTVVATTRRAETLARVRELGIVDVVEDDLGKAVEGCDCVVLCVPVGAYAGVMARIAPHLAPGCVLTDVGSTKGSVVRDQALTDQALHAVITYLIIYAVMNLGAFAVVIAVARKTRSAEVTSFGGLFGYAPGLAVAMTIFLFSLAGIPPLGGWYAKFGIFATLVSAGTGTGYGLDIDRHIRSQRRRLGQNRPRERVLTACFERRRNRQHLLAEGTLCGGDLHHHGLIACEGAGLVEADAAHATERFQGGASLDQHAEPACRANRRDDRDGNGDGQRAR